MFNYMPYEALLGFVQMFEQSSLMHSNFPGKNAGIDFSRMIKIAAIFPGCCYDIGQFIR